MLYRAKAATASAIDTTLHSWQGDVRGKPSSVLSGLKNWLLPRPSVRGRRLQLAVEVFRDFSLVLAAFWATGRIMGFPKASGPLHLAAQYGTLLTLLGYSERLYERETVGSPKTESIVVAKCIIWAGLIWASVSASGLTAGFVIAFNLLSYLFLLAVRLIRRWRACHRRNPSETKNVLIVGTGPIAQGVARYLKHAPLEKRRVIGFVGGPAVTSVPINGRIADLQRIAETEFVDEIILAGVSDVTARQAIREAHKCGIDIKIVPETYGTGTQPSTLEQFGEIPVLTLREERIPRLALIIKRSFDLLGAGLVLIVTLPLLIAIAAAIRMDSPGPMLYAAPRVGFKGRRFKCYKFRTMVADADAKKHSLLAQNERRGACFKIENDPRITTTGKWLRRYSLDELPQLWNVLRGEMSLVGPRPHPLDDFSRYRREDMKRLCAVPGLTGLWQVTARRDPSFERNLMLDREYIEHWSLAGDFKILFKTVAAVAQGSGT
jgi:exopolysaccharide biosynthesis polyprenyl glycosylphosphotransferase